MSQNLILVIQDHLFYYGLLNTATVLLLAWMAIRLHRAEKNIEKLCKHNTSEPPCPVCGAKPGEKCNAGLHG